MFSLILYLKNDIDTIQFALNSILAQKIKDYELIVIDASTDDSGKLCRNFAQIENISILKESHSTNKFQAWNKGMKVARGEYILFMDGKTCVSPNMFERMLQIIQRFHVTDSYEDYNKFYPNIICSTLQLLEDKNGTLEFQGEFNKRFSVEADEAIKNLTHIANIHIDDANKCISLANKTINNSLITKLFKREFLKKFGIRFNELLSKKDATLQFLIDAFISTEEIIFVPDIFCGKLIPSPVNK